MVIVSSAVNLKTSTECSFAVNYGNSFPSIYLSNHPSLNNQQLAYKLVDGVGGSGKPEGWEGGREECVLWASSGCCLSNHRQVLLYVSLSVTQLENSLRSASPHHSLRCDLLLIKSPHQFFTNPYPFDSHSTLPFLSVFLSRSGGVLLREVGGRRDLPHSPLHPQALPADISASFYLSPPITPNPPPTDLFYTPLFAHVTSVQLLFCNFFFFVYFTGD